MVCQVRHDAATSHPECLLDRQLARQSSVIVGTPVTLGSAEGPTSGDVDQRHHPESLWRGRENARRGFDLRNYRSLTVPLSTSTELVVLRVGLRRGFGDQPADRRRNGRTMHGPPGLWRCLMHNGYALAARTRSGPAHVR